MTIEPGMTQRGRILNRESSLNLPHQTRLPIVSIIILCLILVSCGKSEEIPEQTVSNSTPTVHTDGSKPDPQPTSPPTETPTFEWRTLHILSPSDYGLTEPNRYMYCTAWAPDRTILISGYYMESLIFWDPQTGEMLKNLPANSPVHECTWSRDGSLIAAVVGTEIWIWDAAAGVPSQRIEGIGGYFEAVSFNPDGTLVASFAERESSGRVWRLEDGVDVFAMPHSRPLSDIAWSPDGSMIATAAFETSVSVWSSETGARLQLLETSGKAQSLAWSPDGESLAAGHFEGLTVWDTSSWGSQLDWKNASMRDLQWSLNGENLALVSHSQLYIWVAREDLPYLLPSDIDENIRVVAWSPEGVAIAAGYDNGEIQIWNALSGEITARLSEHTGKIHDLDWASENTFSSASHDGVVRIWSYSEYLVP